MDVYNHKILRCGTLEIRKALRGLSAMVQWEPVVRESVDVEGAPA